MIKLLAKPTVNETTFPGQYISRILQILLKRCSEKSMPVVDSVGLCVIQFCATFKNGLNERLNEFIFGILIELLRHDRFDGDGDAISILDALKKCDVPAAFRNKYSLLWRLLGYRKGLGERVAKEEEQGQRPQADTCIILNLFMASNVPWMVIAAITFLSERTPHLVPMFEGQLMDLLDSKIDDIVIAVQGVIHLVFVKPQESCSACQEAPY
jgi:hypothetical protein